MMLLAWKNFAEKNWEKIRYHREQGILLDEIEITSVNASNEEIMLDGEPINMEEINEINFEKAPFFDQNEPTAINLILSPTENSKKHEEKDIEKISSGVEDIVESGKKTQRREEAFEESMGEINEDAELPGNKPGGVRSMNFFMGDPKFIQVREEKNKNE